MTSEDAASRPTGTHPKRRFRNYLLEPRFQLKYTMMVVGVTVLVASVLGSFAYTYSKGQTELLTINQMDSELEKGNDISEQFIDDIQAYSEEEDRKVLRRILGAILLMALALGATGILVTHKLVGPAYKLTMLLEEVAKGRLKIESRLRKGDELQNVFKAFQAMVVSLHDAQAHEVEELTAALASAREAGVSDELLTEIQSVRDRMARTLE